ncbi:MAG TPA: OmpH family outer membrane protein [Saprospiraceae bacterium]|nr:OmpH family outer membrane protein [Saprospiraceae bacterium]HMP23856.1 OmpH family outer membrane protein [Saprospiraceae bacterium]
MRKLLVLLLLSGLTWQMSAQKYGHLNFGNLMALMPETKAADEALKKLQEELLEKGETMAKAFQEKYLAAVKEVQSGTLSPRQQQELQQNLEKEQQALADYEQEMQEKIERKREELLTPIVEKAEQEIAAFAKENGYILVFDTSVFNAILFAQDTDDVLPALRKKLNLPDPPVAEKKE